MSVELKPCPFCGSTDIANVSSGGDGQSTYWHARDRMFSVNCRDCGVSIPSRYRKEWAVQAWNTRTEGA